MENAEFASFEILSCYHILKPVLANKHLGKGYTSILRTPQFSPLKCVWDPAYKDIQNVDTCELRVVDRLWCPARVLCLSNVGTLYMFAPEKSTSIVHIPGAMGRQSLTYGIFSLCASTTVKDMIDCILAWQFVEEFMGNDILHAHIEHRTWKHFCHAHTLHQSLKCPHFPGLTALLLSQYCYKHEVLVLRQLIF